MCVGIPVAAFVEMGYEWGEFEGADIFGEVEGGGVIGGVGCYCVGIVVDACYDFGALLVVMACGVDSGRCTSGAAE